MIDLHSHILPGLDDGARSIEISLGMAESAVEDGITVIAATPHVRDDYPTEPAEMEEMLAELTAAIAQAGIPLEVLPGGEVAFEWLPRLDDEALRRFGLGGNPSCLLLELPVAGWPFGLEQVLFDLRLRGFTVVLAHPERCPEVREQPERLRPLVDAGTLVQVTAASIDGRLGTRNRQTGLRLVELGLAHMIASDAHAPTVRQIGMSEAAGVVGDPALARWLTQDVPAAIVAGAAVPERPTTRSSSRFGRLFGR